MPSKVAKSTRLDTSRPPGASAPALAHFWPIREAARRLGEAQGNKKPRKSMTCEASNLVRPTRFERATPAFGGQYSIQLSYGHRLRSLADRASCPVMRAL